MVTKGNYIKLENKDWRGDARGFCKAIKALEGVTFNPAELDNVIGQSATRLSMSGGANG